nr:hypothetical protein [Tanacetum cinerariifolium]
MYYQKNVDYVYLLWEDLVYQIENKVSKKNKDMYNPRFTKVIINYFMSKDQSITRRNKVDWHMTKDDLILTTMRFIPQHEVVQKYDATLLDNLTNPEMKESKAYKTYYDLATGKVIPKPKYVRRSTREKTEQAPKASPRKRIKATTKVAKSGKKKLPTKGLETLSEVTLSEAEQMKITIKKSKTQFHSLQANGSGAREGTGVIPGAPNVPTYGFDAEQISWKSSNDEDDDDQDDDNADDQNDDSADDEANDCHDDNEQTKSDNDGDDFVHPKLSTFDLEECLEEKLDEEEEGSDQRFQTPSHSESTDDEAYDEVTQGDNVKEEKMDEEMTNEKEEVNELYNDVNINLEGRDTKMTNDLLPNVQATQVIEDTHVIMTAVTPKVQQQSRVKALEDDFSEFKQTNLFAEAVSSILGIVDNIKEQVKVQVKEQVSKILSRIEKFVNKQLEAEVLTRSSNEAKTSHVVATNLSELELKKILIKKMKSNKSIYRSAQHKTLYKALIDAYETDKVILETYGDTGSKRRRSRKEPESTSEPKEKTSKSSDSSEEGSKSKTRSNDKSAQAEEEVYTFKDLEEPTL